jgi:ATP-dependent Lhr-like helicase
LGFVDELILVGKQEGPRILLLGGRSWRVTHVVRQRKVAYVEAAEGRGWSPLGGHGVRPRFLAVLGHQGRC